MLRKIKYFFWVLLLLFGTEMNGKEKDVDYEVFVNEITKSFTKIMEEEFGLVCMGTGGQMPRDVAMISVMFMSNHPASMEEVRTLEVIAAQKFLTLINDHEKIRPFLRQFPFGSDRVQITISFIDENVDSYFDGIAFACLAKNKISYCRFDKEEDDLIEIAEEPYEDALKKYLNSISSS